MSERLKIRGSLARAALEELQQKGIFLSFFFYQYSQYSEDYVAELGCNDIVLFCQYALGILFTLVLVMTC